MRDQFIAYYRPTEQEFIELWEKCFFVLDTNVLLNLYRYSQQVRDVFFKVFEQLSDRLWIPHQVALEYQENRLRVIADQKRKFNEVRGIVDKNIGQLEVDLGSLQLKKRHPAIDPDGFLSKIKIEVSAFAGELDSLDQAQPDVFTEDTIRSRIDELLKGKVGQPFSKEELEKICRDGQLRKNGKVPPGYLDSEKEKGERTHYFWNQASIPREYGDLILWHQVVEHAKESKIHQLVFITDDGKEDWWWKVDSLGPKTIGPRPELVNEIMARGGASRFYMYNSENFLKHAKQYLKIEIGEESIKQVQEIRELWRPELAYQWAVEWEARTANAVQQWVQNSHPNDKVLIHGQEVNFVRVNERTGSRIGYEIHEAIFLWASHPGHLIEDTLPSFSDNRVAWVIESLRLTHLVQVVVVAHREDTAVWIDTVKSLPIPSRCSIVIGFLSLRQKPSEVAYEFNTVSEFSASNDSESRV